MGVCAYCGRKKKMTGEHRWPACLLSRVGNRPTFLRVANKIVDGQSTMNDVCGDCNHGALSSLDTYICQLYDRYFAHNLQNGESVDFTYDYDRLSRWLLKTAYNAARADHEDVTALSECARYILKGSPRPKHLLVVIGVTGPLKVGTREILPTAFTDGKSDDPEIIKRFAAWRYVAINTYNFHIVIPRPGAVSRRYWRRMSESLYHDTGGWRYLSPTVATINLVASSELEGIREMLARHHYETNNLYLKYSGEHKGQLNTGNHLHTSP